ncbi:MAG: prolyl oligopeptidase family serine peptidase [Deltaproteobacteria bacterium]|nr:prolyl oligopeptidase family serine peptidase [Deltaproteobacteria bacterium]
MTRVPPRRAALAILSTLLAACAHPAAVGPSCPPAIAATPPVPPPTPLAPPPVPLPAVPPSTSGYDRPPQAILDVLHAPALPQPYVNPTDDTILLASWVRYASITQVAEPFLRLAGVRVEPRTRRKHDTPGGYGVAPCAQSFTLVDIATRRETAVPLPAGGCADGILWAANGKQFAFRNTSSDAVEIWIGDAATGATRRLGTARLNPMLGSAMQWMPDQQTLLVKLVPDNPGAPPPASVAADGPSIQEADGEGGESSTYETRDTLTSTHDEALFTYYATSQLALVDVASGAITRVGKPAILADVDAAPDGDHLLVESIRAPYSYVTTFGNFARDVEVWDRSGRVTHAVAHLPVADRVPIAGVPVGPRAFAWRPTEPATLVWAEALDRGDWNVKVPARDKVMMQAAPFTSPAVEIARTTQRYVGFEWGERRDLALLREYDETRHWRRTFITNVDDRAAKPALLWDLSSDERYRDPGAPVYRVLANGQAVMRQDGDAIFLIGDGASPAGDRPFLDHLDLGTRASTRLFRSATDALEAPLGFTDATSRVFVTWHQSPVDPPNAYLRTLGDPLPSAPAGEAALASTSTAITRVTDPTPAVRAIKKRLVTYTRRDGTALSFTIYTPPGYVEGTRIPAILNAYPLDYASSATAGQVKGSQSVFTQLRGYQLLLLSGYAIIDSASFPIIGDPRRAYDTYLTQLVDDAKAAVDKAVALGIVDRDRIGVTGHSHGALMTVNLIAHTDLFRAGAATSGSYNKTLTPFGFQNERRSVWKARAVYLEVSPFFMADTIKLPLLVVHGMDDANPGTTPLQAVKLFEAIRGNGGTTRLVMLPHEPHWYAAMESNEQLAYEELRWFDRYVKNAAPRAPAAKAPPRP